MSTGPTVNRLCPSDLAAGPRTPLLHTTWRDHVTGRSGYLVIDGLVRGVASGGLRMREGCTLAEVGELAAGMSLKEALHYDAGARYVPLGGAKGGIDCDPAEPEAYGILVRYLRAMTPYVERFWTTGEDLGLRQTDIDRAVRDAGLTSSVQAVFPLLADEAEARARLAAAFAVEDDSIGLDELVGGCGVAEAVLTALDRDGVPRRGTRVAIQGMGTMGGATARFLDRAGLAVVAVADACGTIANPDGLDVEALLAARDSRGVVSRSALRPGDARLPGDAWLATDAEVLVPAAVSYAIGPDDQARVTARYVAEAANLPVVPEAEPLLAARGITVLPDIVANSGTNAWWWWTLFGDIGPAAEEAYAKVRSSIRELVTLVLDRAAAEGTSPRTAARALAHGRLAELTAAHGTYR
ncbi:Glu/Leu/Phe/Val dehydrogenase dimerization domain-containing protein [Streptomyces bambusae]|uniref:Glutamate dehydrogenase n=1 Tax=Streptomyces bambusae TaxID=1550616 RepID=A0ABS6YY33_9ACTN|nr:Glu/Leu/Phe/Val dehydrogenase dimerization domain-containing protein [Streptomyces bambusae]MBW5480387.1 glutamate dehydrogenase [Streptomyces bambusae]